MGQRDDFSAEVKRALATRVGLLCSNPECRALTAGPQSDPAKAVNIGVAAHITAASPGGPRYDMALSAEARAAATNGVWLCQNCAKRIDNDTPRYSADLVRAWKMVAESLADAAMGKSGMASAPVFLPTTPKEKAIAAITANASNVGGAVRAFMVELADRLATATMKFPTQRQPTFDDFATGINEAKPLVREFVEVASTVAEFNADLASHLVKGYEPIVELYESHSAGTWWESSFDVAKFVGHELFLALVALMIRFEQWPALSNVLAQTFFARRSGQKRALTYLDILSHVVLADALPPSSGGRWISARAEILRSRHEDNDLGLSYREIVDADYLLYLVSAFREQHWLPVTLPYLKETPDWLVRCQSLSHLEAMLHLFGAKDADEFRTKFAAFRVPQGERSFRLTYDLMKPEDVGNHP